MIRNILEVFVSPEVSGMSETVVVQYTCMGYRTTVPMIDAEVLAVSKEVGDSFWAGSMRGWSGMWSDKAHEFAFTYFVADKDSVN